VISLPGGNALLALASAIVWGGGDFSGGVAVKAAGCTLRSAFRVVLLSHTVSLSILVLLALLWGSAHPSPTTWAWGLLAGLFAALSLTTFYVALSGAAMGAAAALSGLLAAAIPAFVSILTEGPPNPLHLAGFAVAGLAIWLVAAGPQPPAQAPTPTPAPLPHPADRRSMLLAIAAGIGFGLYFVAMKMAGRGGLLWPMTTVRIGSTSTCALLVLATLGRKPSADPAAPEVTQPSATLYLPRKPSSGPWAPPSSTPAATSSSWPPPASAVWTSPPSSPRSIPPPPSCSPPGCSRSALPAARASACSPPPQPSS